LQIRPQPKPAPRPAEIRPAAAAAAPQPAVAPQAMASSVPEMHADPVAEAIRAAEAPAAERPAQPSEEFRPNNRLFQAPPEPVRAHAPAPQPAPRMPRVEDFPPVARAELEPQAHEEHDERGPMGLLKRLATGLSRREEEPKLQPAQPREPKLREAEPRRLQDPQLYAPRRGQLDDHGRVAPQPRPAQEDDQLEIPAFLRRQAN
jgi:cell division protein FtsZ